MKTINKNFGIILLVVVSIIGLNSCDKENDDDIIVNSNAISPGYLDLNTGMRIASFNSEECGDALFFYSKDGKLEHIIREDNYKYSFNADNDSITFTYRDGREECDEDGIYTLGYNTKGILSSVSISIQGKEGDSSVSTKWTARGGLSFVYDKYGHLEHLNYSGKDTWSTIYSNGRTASGSSDASISITFFWRKNLISSIEAVVHEGGDDDKAYVDSININFEYNNPEYMNKYRQITPYTSLILWDELDLFSCLGLLGVGPEMLPSGGTSEYKRVRDGNKESDEGYVVFGYDFSGDGAVTHCYVSDDNKIDSNDCYCTFTYDYGVIK